MFDKFPKTREFLPTEYEEIYNKHILENRLGKSAASSISLLLEKWLHKQVAKGSSIDLSTLEIGAGTLNQLQYEKIGYEYDVIEPAKFLYEKTKEKESVRTFYDDIEDVPLSNKYDRITSCAVFEHIENLPLVVSKTGLLLKKTGELRTSIPSEGGFLWKLANILTTGLEFRLKYKLNYSVIRKFDHVNTVDEIEEVIRWFYNDVKIKRLGIGKHFSFYTFIESKNPNINRCNEYISAFF